MFVDMGRRCLFHISLSFYEVILKAVMTSQLLLPTEMRVRTNSQTCIVILSFITRRGLPLGFCAILGPLNNYEMLFVPLVEIHILWHASTANSFGKLE
jgi:hypothetical protein